MDKVFKLNFGILLWEADATIIVGTSKDSVIAYCYKTWGLDNAPYNITELSMEGNEKEIKNFVMQGGQIIYTDGRHLTDELTFLDMIK